MATILDFDFISYGLLATLTIGDEESRAFNPDLYIQLEALAYYINKTDEGQALRAQLETGRRIVPCPSLTWDPTTLPQFAAVEPERSLGLITYLLSGFNQTDTNGEHETPPDVRALSRLVVNSRRYVPATEWLYEYYYNVGSNLHQFHHLLFRRGANKLLHASVFGMKPTDWLADADFIWGTVHEDI